VTDYWNHNTAYHPWISRIAARHGHRDLLDVGCGDGLLMERLAPALRSVTGIEPDSSAIARAERRLSPRFAMLLVMRCPGARIRRGVYYRYLLGARFTGQPRLFCRFALRLVAAASRQAS